MSGYALNLTQQDQVSDFQDSSNNDNVIAALLIYLASIMCADSDTCSDIAEMVLAAGITAGSMFIASIPGRKLRSNFSEGGSVAFTNGTMLALWALSVIAGGYAANREYHHRLRDMYQPDDVDKLSAAAGAALSGSVVTTLFTAVSAVGVTYAAPKIVTMFDKLRERCNRICEPSDHSGYNELIDNEDFIRRTFANVSSPLP